MKREFDPTWNPVMPLVNALRAVLRPSAARWVHWGTTSKNIIDTALALQIKDTYAVVEGEIDAIAAELARLARRHRDTVMAGRTHGQHALPVTFGYKAAVWLDEVLRQKERLEASRPRVLVGSWAAPSGPWPRSDAKDSPCRTGSWRDWALGVPVIAAKTAGDRFAEFFPHAGHDVRHPRQGRAEHLQPAGHGRRRGRRVHGGQGRQHGHAAQAQSRGLGVGGPPRPPHSARAATILDYVHSEWEDDHRQGETAWAFPQEVCLLLGRSS